MKLVLFQVSKFIHLRVKIVKQVLQKFRVIKSQLTKLVVEATSSSPLSVVKSILPFEQWQSFKNNCTLNRYSYIYMFFQLISTNSKEKYNKKLASIYALLHVTLSQPRYFQFPFQPINHHRNTRHTMSLK